MPRYKSDTKKTKKVVNKNSSASSSQKTNKSASNSSSSGGFYYSFLTIILLLCLVQITISAVLNISKIVSYKAKIVQIKNTRDAAQALNDQLKDNISNFSNVSGLEAIARNNLKMSSEDEVLVIINGPKEEEPTKNSGINFFKKKQSK